MRAAAVALIFLMFSVSGRAEGAQAIVDGLDIGSMQAAAEDADAGIDVKNTILAIISGEAAPDAETLKSIAGELLPDIMTNARGSFAAFMFPILVCAISSRLLPGAAQPAGLVCSCVSIGVFAETLAEATESARRLLGGIQGLLDATLPLLTTLSAMGGGTTSAALLTPMTTLLGDIMVKLLAGRGVAIVMCAAVCACAGAIGHKLKLSGMTALLKRIVQVGCGLMLALFAGLLKVQGMLGRSFDSAAVKTARFAVDKIVPSVGGGIADTMDAALSSILLVKSAVGVTGMLALIAAAAAPMVELTGTLLGIRLACAICQPAGDSVLTEAAGEFGDMIRLLIVICATGITLCLVLTGAAIGAGMSLAG